MKVHFAVIGTNVITDTFLEAGRSVPGFCLKGVYSRSKEKAEAYAKKQGAELTFDDLDELAECKEIDAVYVASPNSLHADQSIRMLRAGKHVLCEKTIASNSREFQQMRETALENGVILLEAMRSVYSPGFTAIRENLPKLGTIRRATFQYCKISRRYDNFKNGIIENAFNPELSNGALMDIGVYCVHPLVALFGMPEKILSSSIKFSNGVEGAGTILAQYKEMQAECLYSKIANSKLPSQIQGENATMVIREIPNPRNVTIYYRDGREENLDIPEVSNNNMSYEIQTFIRLIQENKADHPYLKNSEMEMQVMDEVRRQQEIVFPADRK
ncbi:Gfo/Idh/MocA family protein [Brotaphodocola sp.]|uniref:Gfo/Idh/MocA family protein n=1 Tax=Brotaphodocola sp. TaxID=3073577 RepID=UPI003D7C6CBE